MEACSKGHADIVKLLLAIQFLNANVGDVSCVSGKRLHAVISHLHARYEPEVRQEG
jgi:hypothetical protein